MIHTDIAYGKVLVTGEIAFYMQHPKERLVTQENKWKFLNSWLKNRIKKKIDASDVRKNLQRIRNAKKPVNQWEKNLNRYLDHVERSKAVIDLKKTDRQLIDEAISELHDLGFHAKCNVNPDVMISDDEAARYGKKGAFLMMDFMESRFDNGNVMPGRNIEFLATSPEVIAAAITIFIKKCFPVNDASRHSVFSIGSANVQARFTVDKIRE